jgi:hypothetical protein
VSDLFKFGAKRFGVPDPSKEHHRLILVQAMGEVGEEMSVKQLFNFMMAAEKRRELDTAALSEKLGVIQISQQEMAMTWKPKVD